MVVPRSSVQLAQDSEFTLFAVTTFKKYSAEFLQKCREQKWTPRQYKYVEGGKEEEQRELDRVTKEERKVWGEALRLGRTSWSESVMVWAHVLTLRIFVETVLRYGLPLEFVCALIQVRLGRPSWQASALTAQPDHKQTGQKGQDRARLGLLVSRRECLWPRQERPGYQDDAALTSEMAAAGVGFGEGNEYTAYVYYEVEFP